VHPLSTCGFHRHDKTVVSEADLRAAIAAAAVNERASWFPGAGGPFQKEDADARFGDLVRYWLAGRNSDVRPGRLEAAQAAAIDPGVTYGNLLDATLGSAIQTFKAAEALVNARAADVYMRSGELDTARSELDAARAAVKTSAGNTRAAAARAAADAKAAHAAAASALAAARREHGKALDARKKLAGAAQNWDTKDRTKARTDLLAKSGTTNPQDIRTLVDTALQLAHQSRADIEAWSAVFVSSVVRSAALGLKLEALTSRGGHDGRDRLLKASQRHWEYVVGARERKGKAVTGAYHAFGPRDRTVQIGDIIVIDRKDFAERPEPLRTLGASNLHGDIVTRILHENGKPTCAETIGGNVAHAVRRRRYPLADGKLIVAGNRLFAQEDDAGQFAPFRTLPRVPTMLDVASTGRIMALLSPVMECRAASTSKPSGTGGRTGRELELELESPFVDEEILVDQSAPAFDAAVERLALESPFEHIVQPPKPQAPSPSAKPQYSFQVVDSANTPLANAKWAIYQEGRVHRGTLDAKGWTSQFHAGLSTFDSSRPFRIHVDGYVCAIVRGAALLANDPVVEYGGQFLDWKMADAQKLEERALFWQEYEAERRKRTPGVFQFLQHDHVMRRPLKMLTRDTRAVFEACPIALRLGPLVRFVDQRRAVVWVELETPALVRVRYGKAPDQTKLPRSGAPAAELTRHSATVRVGGRHYAVICLDRLEPDSVYLYTLEWGPQPAEGKIPGAEAEFTDDVLPRALPAAVRKAEQAALSRAGLRKDGWLFFRTMPGRFDSFRFAHGSCRKWPADTDLDRKVPGPDMLERFGSEWLAKKDWSDWPRFFLHTGDQIYADDIGIAQGERILRHRFAAVVPGPGPASAGDVAHGAWSGRFGFRYGPSTKAKPTADDVDPKYLRSFFDYRGRDRSLVDGVIDTALIVRKQADAHRKLIDPARRLRFRMRVLNDLLWKVPVAEKGIPTVDKQRGLRTPEGYFIKHRERSYHLEFPSAGETDPFVRGPGVHAADYAEYSALYEQAWSTTHARKALAHVPSYMIFDDHEVTDDWNADAGWMGIVHTKSDPYRLWPMTMTDALSSYWVYQGWGNLSPDAWKSDPRVQILQRCKEAGRDALPELRRLVFERAIRPTEPGAGRSQKLAWNYALPTGDVPFLVVDLRTDRDVNGSGGLSPERLQWLERSLLQSKSPAAFIVLCVPFLMPDPMLFAFRNPGFTGTLAGARSTDEFKRGSDIEHPAGNPVWDQIKALLTKLQRSSPLKTLVMISGDIHFSCNLDGQLPGASRPPRLLQLVSSGLQQKISTSKQGKLIGAYKGWLLNMISRAQGVDTHKGIRITLGGLEGPGRTHQNFLFDTSVALVDVKSVASGMGSNLTRVASIVQTSLTWKPPVPGKAAALVPYTFRHLTQPTGSAVMTLKDPGFKTPEGMPPDYPRAEGTGVIKETDEGESEAALQEAPAEEFC
jgi:hypothetical protein